MRHHGVFRNDDKNWQLHRLLPWQYSSILQEQRDVYLLDPYKNH